MCLWLWYHIVVRVSSYHITISHYVYPTSYVETSAHWLQYAYPVADQNIMCFRQQLSFLSNHQLENSSDFGLAWFDQKKTHNVQVPHLLLLFLLLQGPKAGKFQALFAQPFIGRLQVRPADGFQRHHHRARLHVPALHRFQLHGALLDRKKPGKSIFGRLSDRCWPASCYLLQKVVFTQKILPPKMVILKWTPQKKSRCLRISPLRTAPHCCQWSPQSPPESESVPPQIWLNWLIPFRVEPFPTPNFLGPKTGSSSFKFGNLPKSWTSSKIRESESGFWKPTWFCPRKIEMRWFQPQKMVHLKLSLHRPTRL